MKFPAALCLLVLTGCAAAPTVRTKEGASSASQPHEMAEPLRVDTLAGTFLVSPEHQADFTKVLAGESTPRHYSADVTF
jgi:hypothetical protein